MTIRKKRGIPQRLGNAGCPKRAGLSEEVGSIIPFKNKEFGTIRVLSINSEPWFVAKDVCSALELTNPSVAIQTLDEDERAKFNLGRQGETNIVSEPGLYKLIMRSRKPEAKAFQRWVTHEVLPAIRSHGGYMIATRDMSDNEIMARALLMANDTIGRMKDDIASLEAENTKLFPKAASHDAFLSADGCYTVTESARLLRQVDGIMSRRRLFELLRRDELIEKRSNSATAKAVKRGYLKNIATSYTDGRGNRIARRPYALVTPKGLAWMSSRYCNKVNQAKLPLFQ